MNKFSIQIFGANWQSVFRIPQNSFLEKGRHGIYFDITNATALIQERYGCYAWGSDELIYYCGSFSRNYKRQDFRSNLHGRVHSYLQNHRIRKNGHKNTNLLVFENIQVALLAQDISLYLFRFDHLEIGTERVDYSQFGEDADLVRAVEQLLICSYKRKGQCIWNRD